MGRRRRAEGRRLRAPRSPGRGREGRSARTAPETTGRPWPSLAIGRGLGSPDLVGLALLVDAHALGDLVPFRRERVERRLRVLAADRRNHGTRHGILIAEGLDDRNVGIAGRGAFLQDLEVLRSRRPELLVLRRVIV